MSAQKIHDNMVKNQFKVTKSDLPPEWSIEAADFINKVIYLSFSVYKGNQ